MHTIAPAVNPGLDPDDWAAFGALCQRALAETLAHVQAVPESAPWVSPPEEVRAAFQSLLPRAGAGEASAYDDFVRLVRPYPTGNIHPRFWGWVIGGGTPIGVLAEMLAASVNPNVSGFDDSASLVEDQVLAWCAELFGLPAGGSGLLVSGGTMANVVGLAVARNRRAGFDIREDGVTGGPPLAIYASSEVHSSVPKAVDLLGLGRRALRLIPARRDFSLDVDALRAAVARDQANGVRPLCIVATVGTVNTGAIDDVPAAAAVAAACGAWLHVDGAFGAFAAATPALRNRVPGLALADSLAFDLHKWGSVPIECGCVLVKSRDDQRAAFEATACYLSAEAGGPSARTDRFADRGPQLSRGFRALKVWMMLKALGADRLAAVIEANVAQCRHLAARIEAAPELVLSAPVALNIVCFRYAGPGLTGERGDRVTRRLLVELQEEGVAVPSHTVLDGRFVIRVANVNHRTQVADFDLLVDEVLRRGRRIAAEEAAHG